MKRLRCALLLQFATIGAFGQATPRSAQPDLQKQAELQAERFYRQVIPHESFGLPSAAELNIYAPYLSKRLLHELQDAQACANDYARQQARHPPTVPEKSIFSLEEGLFSGNQPELEQRRRTFKVERSESQQDGSFLVYVQFTNLWPPPSKPEIWGATVRVIAEDGRFAIDDITVNGDKESLAQLFPALGCAGPRWLSR